MARRKPNQVRTPGSNSYGVKVSTQLPSCQDVGLVPQLPTPNQDDGSVTQLQPPNQDDGSVTQLPPHPQDDASVSKLPSPTQYDDSVSQLPPSSLGGGPPPPPSLHGVPVSHLPSPNLDDGVVSQPNRPKTYMTKARQRAKSVFDKNKRNKPRRYVPHPGVFY